MLQFAYHHTLNSAFFSPCPLLHYKQHQSVYEDNTSRKVIVLVQIGFDLTRSNQWVCYLLEPMPDGIVKDLEPVDWTAAKRKGARTDGANIVITHHQIEKSFNRFRCKFHISIRCQDECVVERCCVIKQQGIM